MIGRLAQWSCELLPDGVAMTHPSGSSVASILYRERARPMRPVATLVAQVLAGWPDFHIDQMSALERLITIDGEFAAAVTVIGSEHGRIVHRNLGFVLTDDFYSSVTSTCRVETHTAQVAILLRELLRTDVHALGIRRRRFEYDPPAGYQPVRQSLAVEWIPPDYPNHGASILVHPANPAKGFGVADLSRIPSELAQLGFNVTRVKPHEPISHPSGLQGEHQEIAFQAPGSQPSMLRASVVLRDELYVYPLEITSRTPGRWHDHLAVFEAVVRSVRPLPRPGVAAVADPAVLLHWID